jgi:serine protease Do
MARWRLALIVLVGCGMVGALLYTNDLKGQPVPASTLSKEQGSYRNLVKQVLPAVVSVTARSKRPGPDAAVIDPEEMFRRFFEGRTPGRGGLESPLPKRIPREAFGSGFIIDAQGTVLTNYHVVAGADQVVVTLMDGREFHSSDIKGDAKNDLAVIKLKNSSPFPFLELGDSDGMEIGDRVLAVGAPFGLRGTVTTGIVSAKGRSGLGRDHAVYEDYIQTDAAINPGNSGGPLISLDGKVIGINTMIRTESGGFQGVGLAITSNVAKTIVDQLVHGGKVHRGYLGVQVKPLEPEVAAQLGLKEGTGVAVRSVFPKTPADKAGLKPGDVITAIGGKAVKDGRDLQYAIGRTPVNKSVDIGVFRDGKNMDLHVLVEEQPEDYGLVSQTRQAIGPRDGDTESFNVDKLGIQIADLSPALASEFKFDDNARGVIITEVKADGLGAEVRLIPGLLITKIDKKNVSTASAARETLQKANLEKGLLLQLEDNQGHIDYVVIKAATADK